MKITKLILAIASVGLMSFANSYAEERFSFSGLEREDPRENLSLLIDPVARYSQEGSDVLYSVAMATDSGAAFSVEGLPPGLMLNPDTGEVTGVLGQDSAGRYMVKATAQTGSLRETITFPWYVLEDDTPWVEDPGVVMSVAGEAIDVPLAIRFEEQGAEGLSLKAINLPPGLSLSPEGVITGTIAPHNRLVSYQVTVQAVHYADGTTARLPTWGGTIFTWIVQPGTRR